MRSIEITITTAETVALTVTENKQICPRGKGNKNTRLVVVIRVYMENIIIQIYRRMSVALPVILYVQY